MLPVQSPVQPTTLDQGQPERDHSRRLRKRSSVNSSLHDSVAQLDRSPHLTAPDSPDLTSSPRPSQPPRSQTTGTSKLTKPPLRQSASFVNTPRYNMDTVTTPRSDISSSSPRQRYSDEANGGIKAVRKKSGFSSFVNSLVGSPRRPNISAPENPVHVTHVGYNYDTGEFTVSHHLLFHVSHRPPHPAPQRKRFTDNV